MAEDCGGRFQCNMKLWCERTRIVVWTAALVALGASAVWGLDNGLATKPPMGWMTWERFRCVIDCEKRPDECISEKLIREMADRMAEDGYLAAGYNYLIVDDCWLDKERDKNGRLQPDPSRFPSGIKNLSDYVHAKGLKFGLYEDYGNKTCEGYPGLLGHLKEDAESFAEWGVDYAKIDGCFADPATMDDGYVEFGNYLQDTKRPIVYSCSWPYYQMVKNMSINYTLIADNCNLWRNYYDIEDSWESVKSIINFYIKNESTISPYTGPGHWNDPDMLIIGNFGLSFEQAKTQMAVWSILPAPLIMSHDMRNVQPEFRDILLNKDAIRINQDPLGKPAKHVFKNKRQINIWLRELDPAFQRDYTYAVAVVNLHHYGSPFLLSEPPETFGLNNEKTYRFTEVFGTVKPFLASGKKPVEVKIPPSGALLFKVVVSTSEDRNEVPEDEFIEAQII